MAIRSLLVLAALAGALASPPASAVSVVAAAGTARLFFEPAQGRACEDVVLVDLVVNLGTGVGVVTAEATHLFQCLPFWADHYSLGDCRGTDPGPVACNYHHNFTAPDGTFIDRSSSLSLQQNGVFSYELVDRNAAGHLTSVMNISGVLIRY